MAVGGPEIVRALTSQGMAHILPHTPADLAWFRPASPDLALQGVLAGHQNRIAQDTERLLAGHRRLTEAQARYSTTLNGRFPEHLVDVISDHTQISDLSASLVNTARRDWMTLDDLVTEMPLTDDFTAPPLPAAAGMVRCRSIYSATAMDNPVARRIIHPCVQAGEQARLLPEVSMKMKLADRTIAMLPLTRTGTAAALVIRAPVIIDALREYFELLWDRATPITAPSHPAAGQDHLPPAQRRVLELMAEGLADSAIARRAGISVTTVRRHITSIMKRLGVTSRFAAGAAAHRKGWIG
jgi:DNA-binding CsgD family transcriptional regulator